MQNELFLSYIFIAFKANLLMVRKPNNISANQRVRSVTARNTTKYRCHRNVKNATNCEQGL